MVTGEEHNFIVKNGFELEGDKELFFQGEPVEFIPNEWKMADLLVHVGVFKSKSQARQNWRKTGEAIPDGFTDLKKIGKLNNRITILKAIK